jgi:D-lactate dehydrogenase (cytochrome)
VVQLRPGARPLATDVCVPISRLAECVAGTQADIAEMKLVAPLVGHVGDGNFHVSILIDMDDAAEIKRAEHFLERLAKRSLALEGTCTGEHGVGQGKMKYLLEELGAPALDVMRAVKQAIDPHNIMNPGKIVAL